MRASDTDLMASARYGTIRCERGDLRLAEAVGLAVAQDE